MSFSGKINLQPTPTEIRRFGLRTTAAAPIAATVWLGIIRLSSGQWHWILPALVLTIGLVVGSACALAPRRTRLIHVGWHGLVAAVDWLIVSVALFLFYFLALTPVGLALRLIDRRPLRRRPDPNAESYWQPAEKVTDLQRYHRQY